MIGNWALFLDDTRVPSMEIPLLQRERPDVPNDGVIWCKDVATAKWQTEQFGPPYFMYLDYELGLENSMQYLEWFCEAYSLADLPWGEPPEYLVISGSPDGAVKIEEFMRSWSNAA